MDAVQQWRVQFDAEITFSNGGGLQTQGFRLDIEGADIAEDVLAEYLVRHLGLLMVDQVVILKKTLLAEAHKGSRGGPSEAAS